MNKRAFNYGACQWTFGLLLSLLACNALADFQQSNGLVSMEAENAHDNIARSSHAWTVFTSLAGFSGSSAMSATPNNGLRITSNIATTSPQLDYQINFSDSGAHVLWIRGNGPNFGGDSVHVGLNGVVTATSISVPQNIWGWVSVPITIPSTGAHTLNIWMREDGVRIDKIVVTNDGSTPTGVGPPESPQGNTPPNAVDDNVTVVQDSVSNVLDVLNNDSGAAFIDVATTDVNSAQGGTVAINGAQNRILYTPPAGYTGPDNFDYGISDGNGGGDTATVSVTVDPTGGSGGGGFQQSNGLVSIEAENAHANIARSSHTWTVFTTLAGFSGTSGMRASPDNGLRITNNIETTSPQLDYQINFSDSGAHVLWIRGNGPKFGSDSVHVGLNGVVTATSISVPQNIWGWVSVPITIPSTGAHTLNIWMREDGVRIDKIVVTNDGSTPTGVGPPESPQGNTPPNAVDDNVTVVQDSVSNVLDVLNNDSGAAFIDVATTDVNSAQGGTVAINGAQNRILYTPPAGYTGPDNFDYGISDGNGGGDTATVSVTVDPTGGGNTPPNAVDDNVTVVQDSVSNVLDVLNNDSDAESDPLSLDSATTDVNSAQGGTVAINGAQNRILYTPPAGYTGPDNFDYGISDGNGGGDTATVSVTVDPTGGGGGGFQQSNGLVSMEAENAHDNIARSSHAWTVFTSLAGFSGSSAMSATPNNGLRITSNIATTSPQLDYQINFSDSGAHVLWIRGNGPNFGGDSVHVGLNGVVTATSISVPQNIWGWVSVPITIPSTGAHTLNIWMREDGVRIDKIVVTNDGSTPTGVGPPESDETSTCQPTPSVTIDSPIAMHVQSSTELTVSTTTCLDPVTHAGWGVKFVLNENNPPLQTQESIVNIDPFEVTFSNVEKGEHTVKVQLVDENDVPQSGSNAQQEVQQIGIGDYIIAMGDSITFGVGDDDPSDDTCTDGRVSGGGYPPILCTELNNRDLAISGEAFPHFIANEGIPGDKSADGVAIINSVLANHPEAQQVILWFGMNDARPSNATMSGLNLDPGDTGYNGTYKHNLQQMIDAIQLAKDENGVPLKEVVLAKINIALADCAELAMCPPYPNPETGARSLNIIQYNLVIDDIRNEMNTDADPNNDITVLPPNFFDIFKNLLPGNPGAYIDNIHPSGQGYDTSVTTPGGWVDALCPSCLP